MNKQIYQCFESKIDEKNVGTIILFLRKPFNDKKELKNAVDKWVKE